MALAAAAGISAIASMPAQATPSASEVSAEAVAVPPRYVSLDSDDDCPLEYFCAFDLWNLGGNGVGFRSTELNWATIPVQFRWINNNAESGWNEGRPGAFEDVYAYSAPNHRDYPGFPGVCVGNKVSIHLWDPLRPESNKWFNNCE